MKKGIFKLGIALLALVAGTSCDKTTEGVDSNDLAITFAEKSYKIATEETAEIVFTISGTAEACEVENIITPDDGWTVNGIDINRTGNTTLEGKFRLTAPKEKSAGKLFVYIKTASGKTASGNCAVSASDDASKEVNIVLDAATCTVTPGATAELGFKVTGKGAVNVKVAVTVESSEWKCAVKEFAPAQKGGYEGKISVTAPATVGSSKAKLTITNNAGEEVANEEITLSSTEIKVTFDEDSYSFDALEKKKIKIDVTCGGIVTLKSVTTDLWRVQDNTSKRKEDGSGYTGTIELMAPSIPDEAQFILRVIDSAKNEIDFAVKVICEGGIATPAPHSGANCIVIDKSGTVSFDAVKGNGEAVSGSKVVRIWTDAEGLLDESTLAYKNGEISFKTGASFKTGNALVALLDDAGTIKWSWHLWFVDTLNLDAPSGTFMNMNLGATSSEKVAESLGMLYQWGRKEAFPGPKDFSTDQEEDSKPFDAENMRPFSFADGYAWGVVDVDMTTQDISAQYPTQMATYGSKLPTGNSTDAWPAEADPCPKGWRVPNHKELQEHWGCVNDKVSLPNDYKAYGNGAVPVNYPDEWWPAAGKRMTHNGVRSWSGALRLTNYSGYYWTSTGSFAKSEYDSEADIQDIGYISAAGLSWWTYGNINISVSPSETKTTAASVRCIKE